MVHSALAKKVRSGPKLQAVFFKQEVSGDEPIRSWLKSLEEMEGRKVKRNKHEGSGFDDFLKGEGIYEEVEAAAVKKVIALRKH